MLIHRILSGMSKSYAAVCGDAVATESKTRVFSAIVEMLRWFAGPQIRNAAVSLTSSDFCYLTLYLINVFL